MDALAQFETDRPRMIGLKLDLPATSAPRLLFIGAHSDDIEIGCGGTAIELLRRYPRAHVHWVVLSSGREREREARKAAALLLGKARNPRIEIHDFRTSFFPSEAAAIKECFEKLKGSVSPDVIFSHHRDDLHQDHRIVGELTWNTFRKHMILEYEIPKYDGGLGSPSAFVPLKTATVSRKVSVLMKAFATQRSKSWFSADTFNGLMRLRGIECNAPSGYAEAFYVRKLVL
jgi:LmbE family N-acetylglucosaminyl deacetylase